MNAKIMAALGLGLSLLFANAGAASAAVQAPPPPAQIAAAQRFCDRDCLKGIMEGYLKAMVAHDPKGLLLGQGFQYSENGVVLELPDGLWRTASAVGNYRLWVVEPGGDVGVYVDAQENGLPVLLSVRLKMAGRTIMAAEAILSGRDNYGQSNANTTARPVRPGFTTRVPANQRMSRYEMIRVANLYFDGIENNVGDMVPPFTDDCVRIENGNQTSGRPLAAGATPNSANYSCAESMRLGYYRDDTRLRDRRYLIVDEEYGLVFMQLFFDHDAVMRSYQLKNGQTVTINRKSPWTWIISEVFEIKNGKIGQVEAINLAAPYGMRWPINDGVTMPGYGK